MSSRNYPSVRRLSRIEKGSKRDPPDGKWFSRKAVCVRCGFVMADCEPFAKYGQFYHLLRRGEFPRTNCPNWGRQFDLSSTEVEPFMRKARRRALKRRGIRA